MTNVPFFSNLDPVLLVIKILLLVGLFVILIISFIFVTEVKSLNKVVTILASFSSNILQLLAIIYFLLLLSLFFFTLVIL